MSKRAVFWIVESQEYTTHHSDIYGYEPPETGRDVLCVRSRSKKRARIIALRVWRRHHRESWRSAAFLSDLDNPFEGMIVERPRLDPAWDENCATCKAKNYV